MALELAMVVSAAILFVAWLRWRKSVTTVFEGNALLTHTYKSELPSKNCYAFISVPGIKKPLMTDISHATYDAKSDAQWVKVRVLKRPFADVWIDTITWSDGTKEQVERKFEGLFVSIAFLFGGMLSLVLGAHAGHAGLFLGAAMLAMGGVSANLFRFKSSDLSKDTAITLLAFVKVGKGAIGLSIATLVLTVATIACFWTPSFFMIFPGINCAWELGGMCALLCSRLVEAWRASWPRWDQLT